MAQHNDEFDDSSFDKWFIQYSKDRARDPWLFVSFFDKIKECEEITVVAYPNEDERDRLRGVTDESCHDEYEIPLAVINEVLTQDTATRLKSTLELIKKVQGIPFNEGLAFLIHWFFIMIDYERFKLDRQSLLQGVTWKDLSDEERNNPNSIMPSIMEDPLINIDALLHLWNITQGSVVKGIAKAPDGKMGQPTYMHFPPRWFDKDDLKKLDGEGSDASKVPVLVDVEIAPQINKVIDFAKLFPQIAKSEPPVVNEPQQIQKPAVSRFKKEGQRWSVDYDGKHISLNHSDGVKYIAYLLEHPNTNIHVRELYAIAHPQNTEAQTSPYAGMNSEELMDENLFLDNERSSTDKLDDAELFATYRQSRDDLQRELEEARRNGDSRSADELQTELDNLNRIMAAEFGLDGQSRQPGDRNKQAYDRVSKAINAVKKIIKDHHQTLAAHLNNSLHYDTYIYIYSPEIPINWDI